jgi:exodeoxyribonuclease VII large subunit
VGDLTRVGGGPTPADGAWSVSQVTQHARRLVEAGFDRLWVRGEVTGFKAYQSGHWYFSLRDRQAQVRCVMWRTDNQRLEAPLEDGLDVFAEAQPTVWEERGEFRLTVRQVIPTSAGGLWQLKLERARAALERDGLLDPARKRPLPRFPERIAVVTSPDGAALRDIVAVVRRRWPAVQLLVVPARVQGETAEVELCAALRLVSRLDVDVVIVGRGGGSREDLWAFNSESVARAVAQVRVPTVSAVGHETDVSLTDLVADVRAPTPSAAAEAVVPDRQATLALVNGLARRLAGGLIGRVEAGQQRLDRTADRLTGVLGTRLERGRARLDALGATLDALSPLRVLDRGYAVARDADGGVLRRVAQFPAGAAFRLTVADGEVPARVERQGERQAR